MTWQTRWPTILLAAALTGLSSAASVPCDIVVNGGASSGIAASIQASRMGKSVVLIEPSKFPGGITTGGLGATDIGNKQAIGASRASSISAFLNIMPSRPIGPENRVRRISRSKFLDNDHWPRQIYLREARRMISDYVMTEHNCLGKIRAGDSVGMGAYNMDSHHTQRYAQLKTKLLEDSQVLQLPSLKK